MCRFPDGWAPSRVRSARDLHEARTRATCGRDEYDRGAGGTGRGPRRENELDRHPATRRSVPSGPFVAARRDNRCFRTSASAVLWFMVRKVSAVHGQPEFGGRACPNGGTGDDSGRRCSVCRALGRFPGPGQLGAGFGVRGRRMVRSVLERIHLGIGSASFGVDGREVEEFSRFSTSRTQPDRGRMEKRVPVQRVASLDERIRPRGRVDSGPRDPGDRDPDDRMHRFLGPERPRIPVPQRCPRIPRSATASPRPLESGAILSRMHAREASRSPIRPVRRARGRGVRSFSRSHSARRPPPSPRRAVPCRPEVWLAGPSRIGSARFPTAVSQECSKPLTAPLSSPQRPERANGQLRRWCATLRGAA